MPSWPPQAVARVTTSTHLPAIPHVSRQLTARIVRAYGMTPVEARRWFRQPNQELGGKTPAALSATIDGTRMLVEFLEGREPI